MAQRILTVLLLGELGPDRVDFVENGVLKRLWWLSMDDGSLAQQASNPLYQYLLQFGGGGIAGMAVGYASKVAFRAAMFVLGAILIVMYCLADAGFITVNWGAVSNGIESGAVAAGTWFWKLITNLSVPFVGFGAGAWVGWKKLGR